MKDPINMSYKLEKLFVKYISENYFISLFIFWRLITILYWFCHTLT